ncbi:MAG: hypothetical protein MUC83_01010 [Pirellula sp.]|jgi:hypothetical protein|nr:hypothetical protein [Pirellula sp.]
MKAYSVAGIVLCVFSVFLSGCGSDDVDVVDLNKVLDAVALVLAESDNKGAGEKVTVNASAEVDSQEMMLEAIDPTKQDAEKEKEFLTKLAATMNDLKVMKAKVGVSMTAGGEINGFLDPNGNNIQDFSETKEFTVTIDVANNRLVASDNNGHHRPYGFQPGGFMTGYLLGSMLGRQNSFYGGAAPSVSNAQMSPQNYHKSAVSSVKSARASSARMTTGSKGFSFGK